MDLSFRITHRQREPITVAVDFMLYICKGCDHSFSLPLLPEREEHAFLFPTGEKEYAFLNFSDDLLFYQKMKEKIDLYAYPYLKFHGFDPTAFLIEAEYRLWADLLDREAGRRVSGYSDRPCCPKCGDHRLKTIGRLLPCLEEETDFQIYRGRIDGFLALPEEIQNRLMIRLMKRYAERFRADNIGSGGTT